MRNVTLAEVDALPVPVLPIAAVYPPGHLLVWHEHRRAQFLYAATGTMLVETKDGAWTVPGGRAVLIPPHRPVDTADRIVWAPGDAAQCDLWFPPLAERRGMLGLEGYVTSIPPN